MPTGGGDFYRFVGVIEKQRMAAGRRQENFIIGVIVHGQVMPGARMPGANQWFFASPCAGNFRRDGVLTVPQAAQYKRPVKIAMLKGHCHLVAHILCGRQAGLRAAAHADHARPIAFGVVGHPGEFDLDPAPVFRVIGVGNNGRYHPRPPRHRFLLIHLLGQRTGPRAAHRKTCRQTSRVIHVDGAGHQIITTQPRAYLFQFDQFARFHVRTTISHAFSLNKAAAQLVQASLGQRVGFRLANHRLIDNDVFARAKCTGPDRPVFALAIGRVKRAGSRLPHNRLLAFRVPPLHNHLIDLFGQGHAWMKRYQIDAISERNGRAAGNRLLKIQLAAVYKTFIPNPSGALHQQRHIRLVVLKNMLVHRRSRFHLRRQPRAAGKLAGQIAVLDIQKSPALSFPIKPMRLIKPPNHQTGHQPFFQTWL